METIKNALITHVSLGYENHPFLTFGLTLDMGGSGCVYGCVIDTYSVEKKERIATEKSMGAITEILKVIGVRTWEEIEGKYVRVVSNGWGSSVTKIGNIILDKWFDYKEYFEEQEGK